MPELKKLDLDSGCATKWIELDDRKNKTSESFAEKNQYYRRIYPNSSVLTPQEFFDETSGAEFEQLLNDKTLKEYFSKFASGFTEMPAPHDQSYKKANLE